MSRISLSPAREFWKAQYRQIRIIRREQRKAMIDQMLFGCGFIEVGDHLPDYIRHVERSEVFLSTDDLIAL